MGITRQSPIQRLPGGGNLTGEEIALRRLNLRTLTLGERWIVQRPLHGIERIEQKRLARRFTHPHISLFIGRHHNAALWVAEFHQPVDDRQPRRILRPHGQIELGAANGGGRRDSLNFQGFTAVAHPHFAAQHPQDVLHGLPGCSQKTFRRGNALLEFQLAQGIQLELRPAGQQDRRPAARAGAHRVSGRQRHSRIYRLPTAFPQDFNRTQCADDLAGVFGQHRVER